MQPQKNQLNLPRYTAAEETFHMVSHLIGAVFGLFVLVVTVARSLAGQTAYGVLASGLYGATFILLYSTSSVYHGLKEPTAKKAMQVLDHCVIYFFIAGSYTPIALNALHAHQPALAWLIFGVEWGLALLLSLLTALDMDRFKVVSFVGYLVMGWFAVVLIKPLLGILPPKALGLLVGGGLFYTVGTIWYGLGRKRRYMHGLFHVFVLLGSLLHFWAIWLFAS